MENNAWTVRVSCASGGDTTVHVRRTQFHIGPSLNFDSASESVSALEYVLAAVGADVLNVLSRLAKKRRFPLADLEASVLGEIDNPLTYLGVVGEQGHPGLKRIQIKVYLSCSASENELHDLWQEALRRSPLATTFGSLIEFEASFKSVI
jgi:hypothetical protein